MTTLCLAYCRNGEVRGEFCDSLVHFVSADIQGRQMLRQFEPEGGLYLGANRNALVAKFLKGTCDVLLFVDTDIEFTPNDVYALVDSMGDRQVMAGRYFGTTESRIGVVWAPVNPDDQAPIIDLTVCGMGFTAIRRELLESMERWRWFSLQTIETDDGPRECGEDISFCNRVIAGGGRIYGNTEVTVGHIKTIKLRGQ